MFTKSKSLKFVTSAIAASLLVSISANAQEKLTESSKVFINGIGSIRVGMTVAQASCAASVQLVKVQSGGEEYGCLYYEIKGRPQNVSFMVTEGRIARVNIDNKRVTTAKGAGIGNTEAKIKSLYPGQIKVTPHTYVPKGHYLTFVPQDKADKNYRLVFETDGKRVTRFRTGKLPEVEYVEGCV